MRPPAHSAAALLALATLLGGSPAQDEGAIRKATLDFFSLRDRRDFTGAMGLWSSEAPQKTLFAGEAKAAKAPLTEVEAEEVRVDGDRATVRVSFKGKWNAIDDQFPDEKKTIWRIELRRERGDWKWWSQEPAAVELARRLIAVPTKEQRAKLLEEDPRLVSFRLYKIIADHGLSLVASRPQESLIPLEAAIDVAARAQRSDWVGNCQAFRAQALLYLGRAQESLQSAQDALDAALKSGKKSSLHLLRFVVGQACLALDRLDEAEKEFRAVLESEQAPPALRVDAENSLGLLFARKGDVPQAIARYDAALKLAVDLKIPVLEAQVLNSLGLLHQSRGDVVAALKAFTRAAELASPSAYAEKIRGNIGMILMDLGDYERSLECFEASRRVAAASGNKAELGAVLNNIAMVYHRQGRLKEAADLYVQVLRDMIPENSPEGLSVLSNLSLAFMELKKWDLASKVLASSLETAKTISAEPARIHLEANLGTSLIFEGKPAEALVHFTESLEAMKTTGLRRMEFSAHLGIGLARSALGEFAKAADSFEESIRCIESVRSDLPGRSLRQAFFSNKPLAYKALAYARLELDQVGQAFIASERAKARTLLDSLEGSQVDVIKRMTAEERREEEALEARAARVQEQLDIAVRTPMKEALREELEKARRALEDFRRSLYLRRPELQTLRGRFDPVPFEDLGRQLFSQAPGVAVISYLTNDFQSHLFVLYSTPTGTVRRVHRIAVPLEELQRKVGGFWAACSKPGAEYEKAGRELHDLLIAPAALPSEASHLVIVADGPLQGLPFQALVDPAGKHLAQTRTLSFAPSVTALVKMMEIGAGRRAKVDPKLTPLLAVGSPVMPGDFAALPHSEQEVRALVGDAALTREKASESRVKRELPQARKIHIATHGVFNGASPMHSFLVLTRDGSEDGRLYAREIADLDLGAELVTLSACHSGQGKNLEGEGLLGLSWALLVAGVPSTVVSQWQVSDEGTARLMADFYKNLEGKTKSEALRLAQRELMRDAKRRHPYYWAPFIVVGDWR